jgi:hypothetical protein
LKPETDGVYGDVRDAVPDGVVDFVVDRSADPNYNTVNASPTLWQRKIRWYGLPRDENGDGRVQGWYNKGNPALSNDDLLDVVPVRDVVRTCIYNVITPTQTNQGTPPTIVSTPVNFPGFVWEHFTPLSNPGGGVNTLQMQSPGAPGDYANVTSGILPSNSNPLVNKPPTYTVALGPNDPRIKMIRITIAIEDPNGRIANGQTFQYVFTLP